MPAGRGLGEGGLGGPRPEPWGDVQAAAAGVRSTRLASSPETVSKESREDRRLLHTASLRPPPQPIGPHCRPPHRCRGLTCPLCLFHRPARVGPGRGLRLLHRLQGALHSHPQEAPLPQLREGRWVGGRGRPAAPGAAASDIPGTVRRPRAQVQGSGPMLRGWRGLRSPVQRDTREPWALLCPGAGCRLGFPRWRWR